MRKIIASTLAGLGLMTGLVVVPAVAASATDYGVDLNTTCKYQYGDDSWYAKLVYSGAYGWRCENVASPNANAGINIQNYYCDLDVPRINGSREGSVERLLLGLQVLSKPPSLIR